VEVAKLKAVINKAISNNTVALQLKREPLLDYGTVNDTSA
jgi:hypothetical protein